jgi:protein TonB
MEKSAILHADLLDIVFEGRNKEYGAYDLRRTYNKRLKVSMGVMLLIAILLSVGQLIAGRQKPRDARMMVIPPDAVIENIEQPVQPPPVIPPPQPPPQRIQTIQYTTPQIVDEDVPEDVRPPEITELEDSKIDVTTQEGDKDLGVVAPPEEDKGKGIIEVPKPKEEDNTIFIIVEKDAGYPGGAEAWRRFLIRNLRIPEVAIDNNISGTVIVQFVVDRQGNVSNVEAISGPMELRDEAVRVIKKSGKWTPALQNGNHVPSYKKQPIVIRIDPGG